MVLPLHTLTLLLIAFCQQGFLAVATFVASLTLVALCTGQEATTSSVSVPATRTFDQSDIWKDLLAETEGVWNENYPVYRRDYHISSYKRSKSDKASKILLVGGKNKDAFKDTWIYTPWSNSWFQVANHPQFPFTYATAYEVLPSLCTTLVILIHDVNNVWIFDGLSETWSRQQVSSHVFAENKERDILSKGAVALDSSNCTVRIHSCRCTGSVLFYGVYQVQHLEYVRYCLQIQELRCTTQKRQLQCQWTRSVDGIYLEDTNEAVYHVPAAADSNRGVLYFSSLTRTKSKFLFPNTMGNNIVEQVCVAEVEHKSWRYKTFTCIYSHSSWDTYVKDQYINDVLLIPAKRVVLPYNMLVWKGTLLVFREFPHTHAVSLQDHMRQYSETMFGLRSKPLPEYNPPFETVFKTQSLEIVRFYWNTSAPTPTVSLYRCTANCSFGVDRRRILPSFTEIKLIPPPLRSPNHLVHYTSIYDYNSKSFYVYGGMHVHKERNLTKSFPGDMWTLSMPSTTWWLIKPENWPTAYISSCGAFNGSYLVLFGGEYQSGAVGNELWLYSTISRNWKQVSLDKKPWPIARAGCSLTAASSITKIILFGGYSDTEDIKPEVWTVAINDGRGIWQRMTPANIKAVPPPRFGHSAVILENELIIYGGRNRLSNGICFSDMWAFNLSSRKWRQIISSSRNNPLDWIVPFSDPKCCQTFMLPYGMTKVVVFQNGYRLEASTNVSSSVWMMDVNQRIETHILSPNRNIIVQAAGIWDGRLVYFGKYTKWAGVRARGVLLTLGQNCKPGTAQQRGPSNEPCETCPTGRYSQMNLNVSECIKCPRGATTKGPGMKSIASCICDIAHCVHGSCKTVARDDGGIGVDCTCSFGFIGDRCKEINYVVFILSFFVAFVVIIALACCRIRIVRHRRAKQETERELEETRRAFTIQPQEIKLQCRLDEDCPGGFGQVHKAKYRDMTVAVKQLQLGMAEWSDFRKEFLREIQFMRTIRHPNIVMFMGAGQYDENCPFLVLELMSGGALQSLLQNNEVQLSREDRLQFSLDTATGMNYLHTLQPPRIHRDLKSANLLLSCARQVKVADFGSARLIPEPGKALNKRGRRRRTTRSANGGQHSAALSQHLLSETAQLTSCHIGTAGWRSPELWRKMPYGTATDVYR